MTAPRTHRRHRIEPLEPRQLLAAEVLISEFMASNDNDLEDEDFGRPDWIELVNNGDQAVNLDGWFLTDDPTDLDRWEFPTTPLDPNQRLVVFASGKNRRVPGSPLHTNFRLSAEAGYLGLVRPDGLSVAHDFGPDYFHQKTDLSFGIPQRIGRQQLLVTGATGSLFVPTVENGGDLLGDRWTQADFDDATWQPAVTRIGYERSTGYGDLIGTDVGAQMFDVNTSIYLRLPFTLSDPAAIHQLRLNAQYDDGYVAYLNGQEIARRNAPLDIDWNAQATSAHKDVLAVKPEEVVIDVFAHQNLLHQGKNVLALHALNDTINSTDFLMNAELSADTFDALQLDKRHFFTAPTPGLPNGIGNSTVILSAEHTPVQPREDEPLRITAWTRATDGRVSDVQLHFRVMFGSETSIAMRDDGQHGDLLAGDGVFGAIIPAHIARPGQMIRYRITATGSEQVVSRLPVFADPLTREQYLGTVVQDDSIQTQLPHIALFLEDPAAANTQAGTRGSLFFDGAFYDNIEIDTTGRTGQTGPKKSHDVFFPSDHWFELDVDGQRLRMNDFDIMTDYWNRTKVRIPLAYQAFGDIGSPSHLSMPVRVDHNGEFYGTYSFVDGGNERFLARAGVDPGGALYKMNLGFSTGRGVYKKQTREFESDTDLVDLFNGLKLTDSELTAFLYDNVNIPATINFLVGLVAMAHGDCCSKNLYIYRDTEVTHEWQPLPWDVDSAFGRGGAPSVDPYIVGSGTSQTSGRGNMLFDALFEAIPGFRDMYLRRLRNVLDDYLQPPDTPANDLKLERRIAAMVEQLTPDALLDFEKWGSFLAVPDGPTVRLIQSHDVPDWHDHLAAFVDEYLPLRRTHLYDRFASLNGGLPVLPETESTIDFGQIDVNPVSGDQDEEYVQLVNPNAFAVDLTGWQLDGDIQHTFPPGTVLPAGGTLYVSPDVRAFRARATGPAGGQSLLAQGNYQGHLANHGALVSLLNRRGQTVQQRSLPADLTDTQRFLRISEVMYHPRAEQGISRFEDDDHEFIELINTSTNQPLNLQHVAFRGAVQVDLPAVTLAPGERVVVVRDIAGFTSRYGTQIRIVGEYGRTERGFKLSNAGEEIQLQIANGDIIQRFTYDDQWHPSTDGPGHSLTLLNPHAHTATWDQPGSWVPSRQIDGSPGHAEAIAGDWNGDQQLSIQDVDLFCRGLIQADPRMDLNGDQQIDHQDRDRMIQQIMGTDYGDTNLDGIFDRADLEAAAAAGQYEDATADNSTWASGDWNCDGDFTVDDILLAFQQGHFQATPRPAARTTPHTADLAAALAADSDDDLRTSRLT